MLAALVLGWLALATAPDDYVGSRACAPCHGRVFQRYAATPMARSSGRVTTAALPPDLDRSRFRHAGSGAEYRVAASEGRVFLEFRRAAAGIEGKRLLEYFIGSGAAGRSYLFSYGGFLYQAPVTYYARAGRWDVSPGFERYDHIDLTRPIEPNCLQCHASRVEPLAGTQNGYAVPPFLEDGVGCERCHGPARTHVERMGAPRHAADLAIVNPARLEPSRRDSVCDQCHLTGEARIGRPGPRLADFRPGDRLDDFVVSFVASDASRTLRATSHVEKLWQSGCKSSSGDRLWCGTCHDPHAIPAEAERTAYFRTRCLGCHAPDRCKARAEARQARGDDCTTCHMPKTRVADGGHGVLTDHTIARAGRPSGAAAPIGKLVAFRAAVVTPRELGLAYAEAALAAGDTALAARAREPLEQALRLAPDDAAVLFHLAYLSELAGERTRAVSLYERALGRDPALQAAAVNLGRLYAEGGRLGEAIRLWEGALRRNPALEEARINLGVAHARSGERLRARAEAERALEINPDSARARALLEAVKQP